MVANIKAVDRSLITQDQLNKEKASMEKDFNSKLDKQKASFEAQLNELREEIRARAKRNLDGWKKVQQISQEMIDSEGDKDNKEGGPSAKRQRLDTFGKK